MTNNPTIDGVSRQLLERLVSNMELNLGGNREALRALLDAPAVERQAPSEKIEWSEIVAMVNEVLGCTAHEFPCAQGSIGHQMTGMNFNSLARVIDRVQRRENAALQSTIARLEARVAELEIGTGEAVLFVAEESIGDQQCVGMHATRKANDLQYVPLFTASPAPVAVVLPELCTGAAFGRLDEYRQGWNACLDATTALNKSP